MVQRLLKSLVTLTTALVLSSAGCRHDDTNVTPVNVMGTPSGTWKVTRYQEKGNNETGDFNGYVFEFSSNGTMTATNKGLTASGTWQEHTSNGVQRFTVSLAVASNPLSHLNHDWVILTKTATLISLADDNSSDGEQVQLTRD